MSVAIWIAVSVVGLVISLYLVNESRKDMQALANLVNGRRLAARSRGIRETMRVTVHAAYIVAGLSVLDLLPFRDWVVPILIWGNLSLVVNSLVDARTRFLLFETRDSEPPLASD